MTFPASRNTLELQPVTHILLDLQRLYNLDQIEICNLPRELGGAMTAEVVVLGCSTRTGTYQEMAKGRLAVLGRFDTVVEATHIKVPVYLQQEVQYVKLKLSCGPAATDIGLYYVCLHGRPCTRDKPLAICCNIMGPTILIPSYHDLNSGLVAQGEFAFNKVRAPRCVTDRV